jgi:hypothetical protein
MAAWLGGLEGISFNNIYILKITQVTLTLKRTLIDDKWLLPIEQSLMVGFSKYYIGWRKKWRLSY